MMMMMRTMMTTTTTTMTMMMMMTTTKTTTAMMMIGTNLHSSGQGAAVPRASQSHAQRVTAYVSGTKSLGGRGQSARKIGVIIIIVVIIITVLTLPSA
jgi:hypothetical protein